ncbi:hypothetical protein [Streptomyces sp. N35]|nr:hypothetical protein [Streptomyces sp. N35]
MTAVAVKIRPRPAEEEPEALIVVEDIEALTTGANPGCSNDNPCR